MKFDPNEFIDVSKVKVGDIVTNKEPLSFEPCTVQSPDGKTWMAAFTSQQEYEKGEEVNGLFSQFIDWILDAALQNESVEGIVINPWGQALTLPKDLISMFVKAGSIAKNPDSE